MWTFSCPSRRRTTPSTCSSPHTLYPAMGWWLAVVAVLIGGGGEGVWARQAHEARVDSAHCSYTLVVNEFDVSKCPVMQADAQPGQGEDPHNPWKDSPLSPSSRRSPPPYLPNQSKSIYQPRRPVAGSAAAASRAAGLGGRPGPDSSDKDVGVLRSQVKDLEGRLLEEMVRTRELNSTLSRHSSALQQAERQLGAYSSNFTTLYRAMVFVQRQLQRQRRINKSLNKKLSNVLLDVVEVNNVLTRGPTSSRGLQGGGGGGGKAAVKDFQVQSVAKVRSCPGVTDQSVNFRDCAEVFEGGHRRSGVYYVKPTAAACPVPVWCDMDTPPGGWLLFQRRQDGSVPFKQDWAHYRDGFGRVDGEHWLGNDNLFLLSNQDHYQLRVDLWDFSGNRVHAVYTTFQVAGERDKYQLTITGFSGSAQDSLYRHNKMAFSTPDRDNDGRREAHCAAEWEAGWWFNNCWFALLNGAYHNRSDVTYRGIAWNHWKREQLRKTEMKIRPVRKTTFN
ncbi:uncharacterized protein LOC143285434 [Babylonia areolata]|uniref:uncharacterized protein LOC143285434 n=1 Tax=Babylonia areolata TaxID=304850 RepID=UPI003FD23C39